jgi:hypothetical protein
MGHDVMFIIDSMCLPLMLRDGFKFTFREV